jgi:hypothetical protein
MSTKGKFIETESRLVDHLGSEWDGERLPNKYKENNFKSNCDVVCTIQ